MKKVEAIIRKSKFEEVRLALQAADIEFFTFWEVSGCGMTREHLIYRGKTYDAASVSRLMLSIVVRDQNLDKTVKAIISAAQTGELGDGKIFVSNIEESYRIRTGESGPDTLFIKEMDTLKN